MSHRHHQGDMTRTFAAHLLLGDFHPATVTHDAFITNALVFSAMAFVILGRAKNTLAKQAVALRFVRAVINGFGFQHLTI